MNMRNALKAPLFIFALLATQLLFAQQPNKGFKLYAHWNDTNIKASFGGRTDWKDITGWYDTAKNKEYIISGNTDSVYFFEIGDHTITKRDVEWGLGSFTNRDFEVYGHYVYVVADIWTKNKLLIYDLQYLPDSVHEVYSNDTFLARAHTIYIDAAAKRLYASGIAKRESGGNASSMVILSLENPEEPTLLADVFSPFTNICDVIHETFVRNDTAFCSCSEQGLTIADVKDPGNVKIISSIRPPYPFSGYNHSGWIDPSGKYLTFVDEVPKGLPIKLYDISDIRNPDYQLHFDNGTKATPHNIYWKDYLLYVSYYEAGVVVFDMRKPLHPNIIAQYDTYLDTLVGDQIGSFEGCWGVYPYLPSGKIIASDRTYGMYVLELDTSTTEQTGEQELITDGAVDVYPNPFSDELYVQASAITSARLLTLQGKEVTSVVCQQQESGWKIKTDNMQRGLYILETIKDGRPYYRKVLKANL